MRCHNPFGFLPGAVTFWTIVIYAAIIIPLVYVHESVPPAPSARTIAASGLNLTEAWWDLTTIAKSYHPYNSHENEVVGDFILKRIEEILVRNGVDYDKEESGGVKWGKSHITERSASRSAAVTVFDDNISNVTWAAASRVLSYGNAGYFEGTNKLVYIRGSEDEEGKWWESNRDIRLIGKGGVLVNAHYDSVSTGYGATDDGVGVVSILQLLNYFTSAGNEPKRGIILMLNNAEEDGLLGAKAFAYSPLFSFPTTFVNLEGAGAGGRAILFRASDKEVVNAYRKASHPFGSVLASDGFEMGLVRSQTDYVIWNGIFGQRGLDIAFYRPRPRYHTNQDDTRHTSRDSIWHMLSTSLPAIKSLSNDVSTFSGKRPDHDRQKVPSGKASQGVWFDMFGAGFAVFGLRGLFAWALTLLVASPLVLILVTYILIRKDKYYLFSGKVNVHGQGSEDPVSIGGFRGLIRLPLATVVASALTFASVLLVRKINPLIIYTSPYAVWAMTLSLFYISFWTILKGASVVRPTALQRLYALIWLFVLSWALMVVVALFSDRYKIAAFFPFAFFHSSVFVATVIALVDLFSLEPKMKYASRVHDEHQVRDQIDEVAPHPEALITPEPEERACTPPEPSDDEDDAEPTETTPLTGGQDRNSRSTFGNTYRRSISAITSSQSTGHLPFHKEQGWSGRLPVWTWLLQLVVVVPINVILFGQIALLITSATQNVRGDGGNDIVAYLAIAGLTVLILLPLGPFVHRVSFHLPSTILMVVLIGSLLYNLIAFPFSSENRYKVYFQQDIHLDNLTSEVKITGVEEYIRQVIPTLPSSFGKKTKCVGQDDGFLTECSFDASGIAPLGKLDGLITVDVSQHAKSGRTTVKIDAKHSKICALNLARPVHTFAIQGGAGIDSRFGQYPDEGVKSISLFRRDASTPWAVDLEDVRDVKGSVHCQWDEAEKIPAYQEALKYSPVWVAYTKTRSGLLRGIKEF